MRNSTRRYVAALRDLQFSTRQNKMVFGGEWATKHKISFSAMASLKDMHLVKDHGHRKGISWMAGDPTEQMAEDVIADMNIKAKATKGNFIKKNHPMPPNKPTCPKRVEIRIFGILVYQKLII